MRVFGQQLYSGKNISPDTAYLQTYGLFLMFNGSSDRFFDLTETDIQIMHTAFFGTIHNIVQDIITGMTKGMV